MAEKWRSRVTSVRRKKAASADQRIAVCYRIATIRHMTYKLSRGHSVLEQKHLASVVVFVVGGELSLETEKEQLLNTYSVTWLWETL